MIGTPRKSVGLCLVLGLAVIAMGCATRGTRFNVDSVDRIVTGVTTRDQIRAWFGGPSMIRENASGRTGWGYEFEETEIRSTHTLSKVGRFVARLFGLRTFFPPVDVTFQKKTRHRLNVIFDRRGVVADYNYERSVTPSRRVN